MRDRRSVRCRAVRIGPESATRRFVRRAAHMGKERKMLSFFHSQGAGCIRICGWPIGWAGSYSWGTWWLGLGTWRMIVKAPWNAPLFSERHGLSRYYRLGGGWRVCFRTVHEDKRTRKSDG